MIKFNDLKPGDRVIANFEGEPREGVVTELNREDKEVGVETDVQVFWFKPEDLAAIPLTDEQLLKLGFEKHLVEEGIVKYKKGPFRIQLKKENAFNDFEIWYREDIRHFNAPIYVHELQNHYFQMTKVELV
jgi:hypothetical protein